MANTGAVFKVLIILALGIGGIQVAATDGAANTITFADALPSFSDAKTLPAGDHLHAARVRAALVDVGGDKGPEKIIPRTIFTAGAILAFLYVFATIGILLALPLEDLGLVTGLVDTFEKVFGTTGFGNVLVYAWGSRRCTRSSRT